MKIDKEILNRHIWYEDKDGNEKIFDYVPEKEEIANTTCHVLFPLEITEHLHFIGENGKHKGGVTSNSHIGKRGEEIIIAMVNSGDYTLGEAIILYSQCCERCANVLAYKYLNGKDGYSEHSEEWNKCGTICKFCKDEEEKK